MIKSTDDELAKIEASLRERLEKIEVTPRVAEKDQFWLGIFIGWLLTAIMAGAVILYFGAR
jgi:hypothetical protein